MGRKVRRVPLDFDWPITWPESQWKGYFNPHREHCKDCPDCEGHGASPDSRALQELWYGHIGRAKLLAKSKKVKDFIHYIEKQPPIERPWGTYDSDWSLHLEQEDVNALWENNRLHHDFPGDEPPLAEYVNAWAANSGFGHDTINRWICIEHRCKAFGVDEQCNTCNGSGEYWEDPAKKEAHDNWEPYDPPTGEGWQMWETTSEGSPISPVFDVPEALAGWLVGAQSLEYKAALAFVKSGHEAPSLILTKDSNGTVVEDGVTFIGNNVK